ncbi:MAG: prolipoprotein diacylglyceryl transferase, partial [Candidatus Symbiothrix sp.]|nr:prolipoprotein diacylglyceryl transferase [Candidatus Symbiothrix sp.]
KNVQEPFEIGLVHSTGLNMGQWLSVPFIIAGIWFTYKGLKEKRCSKLK